MIQRNSLTETDSQTWRKNSWLLRQQVRGLGWTCIHTLLYWKWITNKDLLYSTGNSAQCYVAAWTGEGSLGKRDPCIRMAESLHYSHETITTLLVKTSLVAQTVKHLPTTQESRFDPWVGRIPWRRKWQPTPVLLPGKSYGRRTW